MQYIYSQISFQPHFLQSSFHRMFLIFKQDVSIVDEKLNKQTLYTVCYNRLLKIFLKFVRLRTISTLAEVCRTRK